MKDHPCPSDSPSAPPDSLNLSEFVENSLKPRGVLIRFAPEICVIVALGGTPLATKYISSKLGKPISTKPVRDIVEAVAEGKIIVTNRQIIEAADSHPLTKGLLDHRIPLIRSRADEQFTGDIARQFNPRNRSKKLSEKSTQTSTTSSK